MRLLYPLFALTTFLSSFLLFCVQPLLGKHILPWFGGSSAVWTTAMLFFMVTLAFGYVYALWLTQKAVWQQVAIHLVLLLAAAAVLWRHEQVWTSALTPAREAVVTSAEPSVAVFLLLLVVIGIPFVVLSTTSTLAQYWYARLANQEPFALYGVSNIGSFLGLLGYPFLFEPLVTTSALGSLWTGGFFVYVLLSFVCLYFVQKKVTEVPLRQSYSMSTKGFLLITGLAGVPVATMLAGTSLLTSSIAPVPFLWVAPLALYLLSFVITFREGARSSLFFNEAFLVFSGVAVTFLLLYVTSLPVVVTTLGTLLLLFAVYHWCHERLYTLRPDTVSLPLFYVGLSLGGILGSLLIKISVYVFAYPIELLVLMLVVTALALWRWWGRGTGEVFLLSVQWARRLVVLLIVTLGTLGFLYLNQIAGDSYAATRNFFGYKAVHEKVVSDAVVERSLAHGRTNHGFQVFKNNEALILPVSYYGPSSGVGRVMQYLEGLSPTKKVAIAGLGSGGLLAYCKPGDTFTYFEIDPAVVAMADEYFTYTKSCSGYTVEVVDARIAMEAKLKGGLQYDLVVIDAYADDVVPIHLLTTEAIAVYQELLAEGGVIAVHVSSRYLDLRPVLETTAQALNLSFRYLFDLKPAYEHAVPSQWVLLSQADTIFSQAEFSQMELSAVAKEVLWTDSYSSLLPIIRW